jgi:hypothetical protein
VENIADPAHKHKTKNRSIRLFIFPTLNGRKKLNGTKTQSTTFTGRKLLKDLSFLSLLA